MTGQADQTGSRPWTVVREQAEGGAVHFAVVRCDCGRTAKIHLAKQLPPEAINQKIRQKGWVRSKRRLLCPDCAAMGRGEMAETQNNGGNGMGDPKATKPGQQATSPADAMPREAFRKTMALLDAHFEMAKRSYVNGYSDGKVATECGTVASKVAAVREHFFGPLANPEIAALRSELDAAAELLTGIRGRLEALERKHG